MPPADFDLPMQNEFNFMTSKRSIPYIWASWLARPIVRTNTCLWSIWFRAHYSDYPRASNNFDSRSWRIKHGELVDAAERNFQQRFLTVQRERQNVFQYRGQSGAILAGKPDLVGIAETEARICDVRTGQPHEEHWAQMLLQMYFLPRCFPRIFKGLRITGEVIYPDEKLEVYSDEFDDTFRAKVTDLLRQVTAAEPPRKAPTANGCAFCTITEADCSERVEENPESEQSELGDF